ncbi:hypothetical protein N9N26_03370, partial [Candidatus Poseidoniales archaeon]|nr:hypothetical protein [Candidatus Poseidoniales archaeon]
MNLNSRGNAILLCALLLLPIAFSVQAEGQPTAPSITTDWTDDGTSGVRHAYTKRKFQTSHDARNKAHERAFIDNGPVCDTSRVTVCT